MYEHKDILETLNENIPLKEKLARAHEVINHYFPFIARIAICLYDPETTMLKTYLHSSGDDTPLSHYQALLDEAPSLKELLDKGRPRVINDLVTIENGKHEHTRRIARQGYAASYTLPMFNNGVFFGFLFFNSYEKDVFKQEALAQLDIFGHMLTLMVINELSSLRTLTAAVKTTNQITRYRDPETGSHINRMSRFARLIATSLADQYGLDDDYIEHVFMFSPLHDIGKIAIPDNILLKNGLLTEQEREVMHTHAKKGRQIINNLLENFGMESLQHVDILCNIAELHHEAVNGSGYPHGKMGYEIPLEARIVAVADVFDALTSRRTYKEAWSNDATFAYLQKLSGERFDKDCVKALIQNKEEVEMIQQQFKDDMLS